MKTKRKKHKRSNSLSSIYIKTTLDHCNLDALILSVSTMLYCQIVRDDNMPLRDKLQHTLFLEETYTKKRIDVIPDTDSIRGFLSEMFRIGQFPAESCVILLIYINRLMGLMRISLTTLNWKLVVTMTLLLAQKVWDDHPLANADFSILYPVLPNVQVINQLESELLIMLNWKLSVTKSLYARYYFELRTICASELLEMNNIPINIQNSKKLGLKCISYDDTYYYNRKYAQYGRKKKKYSFTTDDLDYKCKSMLILG